MRGPGATPLRYLLPEVLPPKVVPPRLPAAEIPSASPPARWVWAAVAAAAVATSTIDRAGAVPGLARIVPSPTPAPAPAARRRSLAAADGADISLDGAALGTRAVERGHDAQPLVALEPLAAALGWQFVRLQSGARLVSEDRTLVLNIGARMIRDNGELRPTLREPLIDRGGHLYLAATDAARLFGIRVSRNNSTIAFYRPTQISSPMQVVELPRQPTPRPKPTPRTGRRMSDEGPGSMSNAGRFLLSLDRIGGTKLLHLTGDTHGGFMQTHIDSTGLNQLGPPTGTVTIGTEERHVSMGLIPDPLAGIIMRGGVFQGIDFHQKALRRDQFAGRRLLDGRTSAGEQIVLPDNNGSDTIAFLSQNGTFDQTILRRYRVWRKPWGQFSRELLIGSRGAGIGFDARTKGRTFFEGIASYATRGLPLGPNDAPISVAVGHELSRATTVVGGFYTTPQQPLGPFLAASTRTRDMLAAVSITNHNVTASLSYQTPTANFQVYSAPGIQRSSGFQGTVFLPSVTIDAQATSSLGSHDASLEVRTLRHGINFIGGVGVPNGGKPGPIAGISVPVGKMVAIEGSLRPSAVGPYTLRLSLAANIGARRPPSAPTLPAAVHLEAPGPLAPMRLFVDGIPVRKFSAADTTVNVTRGPHIFAVESVDGAFGSADARADIEAAGDSVALALWQERSVTGRLRLDPSASAPPDFTLGSIILVIQPGDITAETSADGSFIFPKQPLAPDSTIRIDPGSLPRELIGADPVPLEEGPMELLLLPGVRVERQIFKSK